MSFSPWHGWRPQPLDHCGCVPARRPTAVRQGFGRKNGARLHRLGPEAVFSPNPFSFGIQMYLESSHLWRRFYVGLETKPRSLVHSNTAALTIPNRPDYTAPDTTFAAGPRGSRFFLILLLYRLHLSEPKWLRSGQCEPARSSSTASHQFLPGVGGFPGRAEKSPHRRAANAGELHPLSVQLSSSTTPSNLAIARRSIARRWTAHEHTPLHARYFANTMRRHICRCAPTPNIADAIHEVLEADP